MSRLGWDLDGKLARKSRQLFVSVLYIKILRVVNASIRGKFGNEQQMGGTGGEIGKAPT